MIRADRRGRKTRSWDMVVGALLILVLVDVGFRLFGFSRVFLFVDRLMRRSMTAAGPIADRRRVTCLVREAVRTASRFYYRRRLDCLPRSLTICVLLRRRGVPATLRIGVKRFPFAAHAWVECLGEVVDEEIEDWRHEPYVPILSTGEGV